MRMIAIAGLAAGTFALAPAALAQTLDDVQETLGELVATHEELCEAPTVSPHGAGRCADAWGGLVDLRARAAMLDTAIMIADMEDRSAPSAAELAQVRADVEAYAAQQPVLLDDLSYQPPEEDFEDAEEGEEAGEGDEEAAEGEEADAEADGDDAESDETE